MPKWQKILIVVGLVYFAAAAPHDFAAAIHSLETAFKSIVQGLGLH